ncbi:MAG TPA: hypothetical protein VKP08_01835, partial [Anaerolineales bacterium]|nr:hypothetical protein [Anaerolineales bacterium]
MTTPASDQNENSKMKKILSGNVTDSIRARLPHVDGGAAPAAAPKEAAAPKGTGSVPAPSRPQPARSAHARVAPASDTASASTPTPPASTPTPAERAPRQARYKFLPAFWTIASALSLT